MQAHPLCILHRRHSLRVFLATALIFYSCASTAALDKAVDQSLRNDDAEVHTQKKIDKLSDSTRALFEQYQLLSREHGALRIYNDQLERLITSQETEKYSIRQQMADIDLTQREIVPLMLRMIDKLDEMVRTGIPFLPDERAQRVARLHEVMDRSDVAVAEKYRQILEAYQIELDYGRTIEAYQSLLTDKGRKLTVNFLRVGRLGLYYQTLDGKQAGYWDKTRSAWQPLPDEERLALRKAFRVARKQVAPDFIQLRVPAPEKSE